MTDYHKKQIEPILTDNDDFFRIKVMSGNHQSNWMNVSRSALKKIKIIMTKDKI